MSQQDQYIKQRVEPMQGMANTPQAHAIKDEQASDMLNLRFHKLGYLVNRNGVRAFEITGPMDDYFTRCSGATALGEFVLSDFVQDKIEWRPFGTGLFDFTNAAHPFALAQYDRMLVMGVRVSFVNPAEGALPQPGRLLYVAIPLGALPDNHVSWQLALSNTSGCIWFSTPETANGNPASPLLAPARRMARPAGTDAWVAANGRSDDDNWIEHYQQMQQFAGALVIADRVNGDLILHDEFDAIWYGR